MACSYNARYGGPLMLSATIQEEDEEDFNDSNTGFVEANPEPAPAHHLGDHGRRSTKDISITDAHSQSADRNRRLSQLAASAVTSVATATSKFIDRVFYSHKGGSAKGHRSHSNRESTGIGCAGKATAALAAAVSATPSEDFAIPAHGQARGRNCCGPKGFGVATPGCTSDSRQPRTGSDKHLRYWAAQDHQDRAYHLQRQQQQQRTSHLVPLMTDNDVRLALQALQIAAQVYDHVWGPDPASGDGVSREVLLEADTPLYDTAMAAARAIQHRALHSLVKQAVRRYVNPHRGSPDDVLRVILELLTGCGGAPAVASPPPPPSLAMAVTAASGQTTFRCISDVPSGDRGFGCCSAEAGSPPREHGCNGDCEACSPRSPHQRISCGDSSLGGRSSTRSSLDSCGGGAGCDSPRLLAGLLQP